MTDWLIGQIDPDNLNLQNTVYSTKSLQYEAKESIFAGRNVTTGTQGDLIVKDNSNVSFAAGESIVLKPGFSVKSGSIFHAYIKDYTCSATSQTNMMARSSGHKNNSENTNNESNNKLPINQSPSVTDILKPDRIKLTPNPTNGEFEVFIDQPDSKSVTIQVFNMMGSLVYSDIADVGLGKRIYLNDQPNGIYLLKITNKNGKITTEKIIKQ